MNVFGKLTICFSVIGLGNSSAVAQGVDACNNIPTVYTSEKVVAGDSFTTDFGKLQCSANWKSAQDATNAGIGVDVPIYEIPVSFTAKWDQNQVEQWKSENCTDEERSADYASQLYRTTYEVDRITAQAQLECIRSVMDRRALTCGVTETGSSIVFEAFWRRTAGEADNPPTVSSFNAVNTECIGIEALEVGADVIEGCVTVLCQLGEAAPMFSLNTDRGSCVASGSGKENTLTLAGDVVSVRSLI